MGIGGNHSGPLYLQAVSDKATCVVKPHELDKAEVTSKVELERVTTASVAGADNVAATCWVSETCCPLVPSLPLPSCPPPRHQTCYLLTCSSSGAMQCTCWSLKTEWCGPYGAHVGGRGGVCAVGSGWCMTRSSACKEWPHISGARGRTWPPALSSCLHKITQSESLEVKKAGHASACSMSMRQLLSCCRGDTGRSRCGGSHLCGGRGPPTGPLQFQAVCFG